jgi:caveolin 1
MTNDSRSASPEPSQAADTTTQTESKPNAAMDKLKNWGTGLQGKIQGVDKDKFKERVKHTKVEGLEYVDRDPTNIHRELKVNFKDVIAEPDGVHSFSTVWGTSYKTYSVSKYWCYRILTAVLGIPFALFWGLYFAFLAFLNVWCVVPFVKCFVIQMKFISQVWGLLVNTFLDPFFESIGKIFANIRLHLTMTQK